MLSSSPCACVLYIHQLHHEVFFSDVVFSGRPPGFQLPQKSFQQPVNWSGRCDWPLWGIHLRMLFTATGLKVLWSWYKARKEHCDYLYGAGFRAFFCSAESPHTSDNWKQSSSKNIQSWLKHLQCWSLYQFPWQVVAIISLNVMSYLLSWPCFLFQPLDLIMVMDE